MLMKAQSMLKFKYSFVFFRYKDLIHGLISMKFITWKINAMGMCCCCFVLFSTICFVFFFLFYLTNEIEIVLMSKLFLTNIGLSEYKKKIIMKQEQKKGRFVYCVALDFIEKSMVHFRH